MVPVLVFDIPLPYAPPLLLNPEKIWLLIRFVTVPLFSSAFVKSLLLTIEPLLVNDKILPLRLLAILVDWIVTSSSTVTDGMPFTVKSSQLALIEASPPAQVRGAAITCELIRLRPMSAKRYVSFWIARLPIRSSLKMDDFKWFLKYICQP